MMRLRDAMSIRTLARKSQEHIALSRANKPPSIDLVEKVTPHITWRWPTMILVEIFAMHISKIELFRFTSGPSAEPKR